MVKKIKICVPVVNQITISCTSNLYASHFAVSVLLILGINVVAATFLAVDFLLLMCSWKNKGHIKYVLLDYHMTRCILQSEWDGVHTHKNQISSFCETEKSMYLGGGDRSIDYLQLRCVFQVEPFVPCSTGNVLQLCKAYSCFSVTSPPMHPHLPSHTHQHRL